ncbi:uncharacterized protein LACBIDRAFT_335769 [Laccaria bicolor S238N-H82]|uniref:Predicted protein n=1 Tax=Laccaria bicolor (strain S238N-H82 / ATCC MYA-4686) TaxID=486041 RepID=B0E3C5_LACBS|nr:uncharacterized protein LACBIDRAFT_335769 [Laccaria bicolor S238N-H82]EDQ98657.1 predicted protein [Laccaria bicolor S238N-H82]|eukprot:XP_001890689.1 predicted protein [Laccaria bicolor S238N-H82]
MDSALYESFKARILVDIRDHVDQAYDNLREEDAKQDEESNNIKQSHWLKYGVAASWLITGQSGEIPNARGSRWTPVIKQARGKKPDIEPNDPGNLEARVQQIERILQFQPDTYADLPLHPAHKIKKAGGMKSNFDAKANYVNLEDRVEQMERILKSQPEMHLSVDRDEQSYVDEALPPIFQALELLNGELQCFRADLENVTLLVNTQDSTPYIPVGMPAGELVDLAPSAPL